MKHLAHLSINIYITLILCFLGVSGGFLASTGSVLALANPTSIEIVNAKAFENVFEAGDMLFLVTYNLNYTSTPTDNVQNTYSLNLLNNSLTTLYASRPLFYYGYNIQALYFSHAQVVSQGLVWRVNYYLRITVNPAYITPLEGTNQVSYGLGSNSWIDSLSVADNNIANGQFSQWLVYVMQNLEVGQSQTAGYYVGLSSTGLTITSVGRALLATQAIPGVDAAVPSIFNTSVGGLGSTGTVTNLNTNLQHSINVQQILGTTFEQEKQNISSWMGISTNAAGGLVAFFIMALMFGIAFFVIRDTTSAMLITFALSIVLAGVGLFPINLLFALLIAAAAYMLFLIFRFVF